MPLTTSSGPDEASRTDPDARLSEIDWLRGGAILLVFVIHVAQIFSPIESWHIDSAETSWWLGHLTIFLGPWIMPLFMFLAGAAALLSRSRRGPAEYLRVRVWRLLVPLVAGTLLVIPAQVYYRRVFRAEFTGTLLEFYPRFFDGVFPEGNFSYGHLWFIAYLFAYMLAAVPLFRWLEGESGRRFLARGAAWTARPGGILLPVILLALGQLLLRVPFTATTGAFVDDWATHAWLFTTFLLGYAFLAEPRFLAAVDRQWPITLAAGVVASVGVGLWAWPEGVYHRLPGNLSVGYVLFWTGFTLGSWSWLVVALGLGRRYLVREPPALRASVPLVYPFYIFHQTVIVVVGFYLVGLPLGVHLRFLLIGLASFLGTFLVLWVVSRIPGLRTLFGLQPGLPDHLGRAVTGRGGKA